MARNDDNEIDVKSVLAQLAGSMEIIASKQGATSDSTLMEMMGRMAVAFERLSESQLQGAKMIADETRRSHRPSVEVGPQLSVFNRRGVLLEDYQKPLLKCIMLIPWLAEWESLTREEVELLNLLEPGEYNLELADESVVGGVTITVEYKADNVTPSRMLVNHPSAFNNENFKLLPALSKMLRHYLDQHKPEVQARAALVISDREEARLIKTGKLTVSQ